MRYTVVGSAMAAMLAVLGFYAAGEDSYYGDGTTRWEHATRSGGTFVVTVFAVLAASSLTVILIGVTGKGDRWNLLAIPAIALFVPLLLFAYALLSLGH